MRRLRRPAQEQRDAGTTLVELLVSMLLVGLLGTSIALAVVALSRANISTTTRVRATEQAAVTIDRVSRVLRSAVPVSIDGSNVEFVYGDADHVTLYSDLGDPNGPEKIDLSVPTGQTSATMTQTTTVADAAPTDPDATYTWTKNTPVVSQDGTDIDTAKSSTVFTYYELVNGVLTAQPTPLNAAAQAGGTTGLYAIGITLTDQEPGRSSTVTDTSLIYLRSNEYGAKRG